MLATLWLILKGFKFIIGLFGGKLLSGLPFLLQHMATARDNDHEFRMAQLEADTRKDEAVRRIEELRAQVEAMQATADLKHQESLDRVEEKIVDSTVTGQALPFVEPKGWFQTFVDGVVALTNAYNAWMRPYSFTLTINLCAALVGLEFYVLFFAPDLLEKTGAIMALTVVEVFTDALPVMIGHLWGERSYAHRMEG
jgi:hypothetical protein